MGDSVYRTNVIYSLWDWTVFSCLVVIDLAAKVHPAHVLNKDVQGVPLPSSDVRHQHSVSLQQALENLFKQMHTLGHEYSHLKIQTKSEEQFEFTEACLACGVFPYI